MLKTYSSRFALNPDVQIQRVHTTDDMQTYMRS